MIGAAWQEPPATCSQLLCGRGRLSRMLRTARWVPAHMARFESWRNDLENPLAHPCEADGDGTSSQQLLSNPGQLETLAGVQFFPGGEAPQGAGGRAGHGCSASQPHVGDIASARPLQTKKPEKPAPCYAI